MKNKVAIFLGIFLTGLLVGWIGARYCPGGFRGGPRMEPKPYPKILEKLHKKLEFTPEQKTQVEAILKENHQKVLGLHNAARPQFDEIRRDTDKRIGELLTPEQREKFEKLKQRWEARRNKRRPHGWDKHGEPPVQK